MNKYIIKFFLLTISYLLLVLNTNAQSKEELNINMLEAVKNNQIDSVKYWIKKGADVNYTDTNQQSALHLVISNTHNLEIVNFLLTKKINSNIKDSKGITPLMLAAYHGFTKWCYVLCKNGALVDLTDNNGNKAIDYANGNCNYRVIEFLQNPQSYIDKPDYQDIYSKAVDFEGRNDYETAIKYAEQTLKLIDNETCENNRIFVKIRIMLALLYVEAGKTQEGMLLLNNIIKTCIRIGGNSKDFSFYEETYLHATDLLASLYVLQENYYQAELLYKDAENAKKEIYGANDVRYITSQFNLGYVYMRMGKYTKAELIYEQTLNSLKELFGERHPDYVSHLSELGDLYKISGNYSKAEKIYEQSMNSSKEVYGENSAIYVTSLSDLGEFYMSVKDYAKAKPLLENALEIKRNISPEDYSPEQASLAILYWEKGDYAKSEPMFELVLQHEKEDVLTTNGRKFDTYLFLGVINEEMKNNTKALNCYLNAFEELKDYTRKKFDFLSEKERKSFWNSKMFFTEILVPSFTYNFTQDQSSLLFAYDNLLFSKGLILNSSQKINQLILNGGDSSAIKIWEMKNSLRRQICSYESHPKEKQSELNKLEEAANQLDNILMQESQDYRQSQSEKQIGWQDVQSKLKDKEAAIEFSSFRYFHRDWTDSTMYCALVLKKGMEYPVMVPLCEQKQLDSLFVGGNAAPNILYASRGVESKYEYQLPNGQKLYKLIWEPLEKELQNVKTVYYSPSGSLHQIAFVALPIDTAHYLCDRYNLIQLSSTRQLATSAWQTKTEQISSTALFGGIKYDLEGPEIAELQRSLPKNEIALSRWFTSDSSLRSSSFDSLPGTRKEVEAISGSLISHHIKTSLYTGISGNEETFKALSNHNISVLHIATHGFFYPDEKEKPQDLDRMMLMGEQKFRYVSNPLRRSGLILAGGNRTWKGKEPVAGMEDGILTAQEISEMNLQNTELVVLSACETGLGDIKGSEGVFGLQRAFKLAGVKTIIMSLWKVDDDATRELMQSFYVKWLGGMDKHEAFRLAQQELKKNKEYEQPYYWAGFVMVD